MASATSQATRPRVVLRGTMQQSAHRCAFADLLWMVYIGLPCCWFQVINSESSQLVWDGPIWLLHYSSICAFGRSVFYVWM